MRSIFSNSRPANGQIVDIHKCPDTHQLVGNGALVLSIKESAPGETRTPGLRIRSPTLYPTELRARICIPSIFYLWLPTLLNPREKKIIREVFEQDAQFCLRFG